MWKIYLLRSKIDPPKIEKYSKTIRGLFKITLLAYPQRGWKSDPKTPHFGKVFGAKIDSRSEKLALEIVTKIKSNFNQIFNRFWLHFGPHGPPKNSTFFIIFWSWCHTGPSWRQEAPKVLQDGSRARFSTKLVPFWGQLSMDFVRFRSLFFIQFLTEVPIPCFIFDDISTGLLQFATLFLSSRYLLVS